VLLHTEVAVIAEDGAGLRTLRHNPRRHRNQILEASAIERDVLHELPIDNGTHRSIGCVDAGASRFDGDALRDGSDGESKVE
jgi:hypothetical protein